MSDPIPHHGDTFDRLLNAMPQIAEAVNAFSSEENQRAALSVLVRALGLSDDPPVSVGVTEEPSLSVVPPLRQDEPETETADVIDTSDQAPSALRKPRSRKAAAKKSYPRVKDINFRPEGKQSLRDFVAEKVPANYHEKNLAIVYYLKEFLDIKEIEVGHVLAAYDECGWKSPSAPDNSLMVTASQKHWLDTSKMKSIRTTHSGRNTIQFDMPIKKENKSA